MPGPEIFLLASHNPHKLTEISLALADVRSANGSTVRVLDSRCLPPGPEVEETGTTFSANALIKAEAYAQRCLSLPVSERPHWVLADDSGLCVDQLDGAPGVHSARYAGPIVYQPDNNRKLLAALADVPPQRRGADFVCVIVVAKVPEKPGETITPLHHVEGRCRGEILPEARGEGGFGYDPLFWVPSVGKSFAELTREEKNRVSHRGAAVRALREWLATDFPGTEKMKAPAERNAKK